MNFEVKERNGARYLNYPAESPKISTLREALDLVGECMSQGVSRLMLHEGSVSEEFFRLYTGLAGDVLQKLVTYHIRAALVVGSMAALKGKFYDFVLEANRSGAFRVFESEDEAEAWLCGE